LRDEIARLENHRAAVARLATADALALPAEVVDYLGQLRRHGFSERIIAIERDQWLLVSTHAPDRVAEWVTAKAGMLDDSTFVTIYRTFDDAFDWKPGDPRLDDLADQLVLVFGQTEQTRTAAGAEVDDAVASLLGSHSVDASPGWRHLATLLAARGLPRP
jgi:hypothetical protein